MKKILCFLLATFILLSTASCVVQNSEGTQEETRKTSELEAESWDSPFGKYDQPIEITYAKVYNPALLAGIGETEDDNRWTRLYEKELGIDLKFLWSATTDDEYNTKLNLGVSSGVVPDYMYFGANYQQISNFAKQGLLADLSEAVDKYTYSYLRKLLTDSGDEIFYPATIDGKLYAIPQLIGGETQSSCFMWMRKDWLDNLGLDAPETIEELDYVFDAFVNKDPDGNSEKDTLALGFVGNHTEDIRGFFYCFHSYPAVWVEDSNNKLVYGSVMDTIKPALAKLREYYSKGYLIENYYEKGRGDLYDVAIQGKLGGYVGGQTSIGSPLNSAYEKDNNTNWSPFVLPSVDGKPVTPVAGHNSGAFYGMSSKCEHPEILVKMWNIHARTLWDPEYTDIDLANYYGNIPATSYSTWHLSFIPVEPPGKNTAKLTAVKEAFKTGDPSKLVIPEYRILYDQLKAWYDDGDMSIGYIGLKIFGLEDSAHNTMPHYLDNNLFIRNKFYAAYTPKYLEAGDALRTMEIDAFREIIVGEKPLDHFDTFVTNWYDAGGREITEEVNAWYATVNK